MNPVEVEIPVTIMSVELDTNDRPDVPEGVRLFCINGMVNGTVLGFVSVLGLEAGERVPEVGEAALVRLYKNADRSQAFEILLQRPS